MNLFFSANQGGFCDFTPPPHLLPQPGILLLHHIYSSNSNLGHVYGLLYYSFTLSRLHNDPLYGHVYDDYVMKKHVLCNFCVT